MCDGSTKVENKLGQWDARRGRSESVKDFDLKKLTVVMMWLTASGRGSLLGLVFGSIMVRVLR